MSRVGEMGLGDQIMERTGIPISGGVPEMGRIRLYVEGSDELLAEVEFRLPEAAAADKILNW